MYVYNCIFEAKIPQIKPKCGHYRKLLVPGLLLWKFPQIIRFCVNSSRYKSHYFEEISNPEKSVCGRSSTFLMSVVFIQARLRGNLKFKWILTKHFLYTQKFPQRASVHLHLFSCLENNCPSHKLWLFPTWMVIVIVWVKKNTSFCFSVLRIPILIPVWRFIQGTRVTIPGWWFIPIYFASVYQYH